MTTQNWQQKLKEIQLSKYYEEDLEAHKLVETFIGNLLKEKDKDIEELKEFLKIYDYDCETDK